MARPRKNNADYFSHDADMRNDPKIKALRRKFRHTGYAVWNYLLETLADSDYFQMEWSDLNVEILSGDFDVETDELRSIVDYCAMLGLLQIEDGTLTCENLKARLTTVLSRRKPDKGEFSAQKPTESGVNVDKNTQSKVKESKVKNNKDYEDHNLSLCEAEKKDRILKYFLFDKKIQDPKGETERFWAHYEKVGWVDSNGNPIRSRLAAAKGWKCSNPPTGVHPDFYDKWDAALKATGNPLLLELRGVKLASVPGKGNRLDISLSGRCYEWLEGDPEAVKAIQAQFNVPVRYFKGQ